MAQVPVRYWSVEQGSARWLAFEHRPGDIVISTRSEHGTTWTLTAHERARAQI